MTLLEGKINQRYIVKRLQLEETIERRLKVLGLTNNTSITVLNNKKSGSVILKIQETRLAVGKKIADSIIVEKAEAGQ